MYMFMYVFLFILGLACGWQESAAHPVPRAAPAGGALRRAPPPHHHHHGLGLVRLGVRLQHHGVGHQPGAAAVRAVAQQGATLSLGLGLGPARRGEARTPGSSLPSPGGPARLPRNLFSEYWLQFDWLYTL